MQHKLILLSDRILHIHHEVQSRNMPVYSNPPGICACMRLIGHTEQPCQTASGCAAAKVEPDSTFPVGRACCFTEMVSLKSTRGCTCFPRRACFCPECGHVRVRGVV